MSPPATATLDERFAAARGVADAVCYEGYVLYPYRASAGKNRVRWQFGVLAPPAVAADGSEKSSARAEMVVETRPGARVHVRLRALQVQQRTAEAADADAAGGFRAVESLDDGAEVWTSFDEALAHNRDLTDIDATAPGTARAEFHWPQGSEEEALGGGRLVRRRRAVDGRLWVEVTPVEGPFSLSRVAVGVDNVTDWQASAGDGRDEAMRRSLVAVHLLVAVDGGRPVSSLDPPRFAADAVAACRNEGLFPVLVGERGEEVVLASPIILYDHPAIAPESQGDMFDATEIDEILALRVLTLTDEEKREARGTDPRAAAIIDRCDSMGASTLDALHGTFRSVRDLGLEGPADPSDPFGDQAPWWEPSVDASFDPWTDTITVAGTEVGKGTRVRLHPLRRSDAQDTFVDGREATVAGVFHEVSGDTYLAVAVDDPDADLHAWHGRYLYFAPEEVEVLGAGGKAQAVPLDAAGATAGASEQSAATAGASEQSAAGAGTGGRVLVAGVGNIFLGDDGFGVEVAHHLAPASLPAGVKVADFGIRGIHLAYELLEGYGTLVLVDAVKRGDPPGTVTVIEHDPAGDTEGGTLAAMDAHGMDPAAVLAMAGDLGASVERVLVVACEAADVEERIGLSPAVAAAVPRAVEAVTDLVYTLVQPPTAEES